MATTIEDFLVYAQARDTGDTVTRDKLCAQIVKQNTPLVKMLVRRFQARWKTAIPPEDLLQSGIAGMLRALTTYNPRGAKFSTYAGDWIRKYLQQLVKAEDHDPGFNTPADLRRDLRNYRDRHGRWPEPWELPPWPERVVRRALLPSPVFLRYSEPGGREDEAVAEDRVSPGHFAMGGRCAANELDPEQALGLKQGLAALDPMTLRILGLHSDGISAKKIAAEVGKSELFVIDAIDKARKVVRMHLP